MNIARLIINNIFIINRRGVVDHENTETKNDVAGSGNRPGRVDLFGLAMTGSVLGSKLKELPVALVVLDQPEDHSRHLMNLSFLEMDTLEH
ncbi:hypothetical protein [Paenibacillus taichungensis]|uniref:hypothetical protein n=1 Tax=Paenibacillus taichungensis TaxID=484184 RepID=UPI0039A1BEA4